MPKNEKELRYLQIQDLQFRKKQIDDSEKMTIEGYVVKFNERSSLLYGEFYEKVAKGAFARSIQENTIKGLWNHNTNLVLGSTKSGTLRLNEDDIGLHFEIDLPNNETGRNAYESIVRGDVDGVSFGFYVKNDNWEYIQNEDIYERTLLEVDLFEISPTPFPAYEGTSTVGKRSIMEESNIMTKEARKEQKLKQEQLKLKLKLIELES